MVRQGLLLLEYLQYLALSNSRHGTHSPFVFAFAENVLYKKVDHPLFYDIELVRQRMLSSSIKIQVEDFGAGGQKKYAKPLSELVANAAKNSKYAKLLHRIVAAIQPQFAIELGTNFGISAMYQAAAMHQGSLFSIEGSSKIAEIARYNIEKTGLNSIIQVIDGTFDNTLPVVLSQIPHVDYAFLDGNHQKDATLRYFDILYPKLHNNSVLVFDDIRWSEGMKEAWQIICKDPRVTVSIDLFFLGIVFFRREQVKEHFVLRF